MSLARKRLLLALPLGMLLLAVAAGVFLWKANRLSQQLVIWTDKAEVASCVELFNATHEQIAAYVVYKENLLASLAAISGSEVHPDVLVGSWLKSSPAVSSGEPYTGEDVQDDKEISASAAAFVKSIKKNFRALDRLFESGSLSEDSFYANVLEWGRVEGRQYLIPVSFNLPAVIFSKDNESFVEGFSTLSLTQIEECAASFNRKNASGSYTAMGFSPFWDDDFLYVAAKLYGADFRARAGKLLWEEEALTSWAQATQKWSQERNGGSENEQSFQFKYLYTPGYKQVESGRCLFSYTTSDELFSLSEAQTHGLSFRWVSQDGRLPVEDAVTTLALCRRGGNRKASEVFCAWLFDAQTQRQLLERTARMNLDTTSFGIAGGFSSMRQVNESYYPAFHRELLGKLPPEDLLELPEQLPSRWESLKKTAILPYLKEASGGTDGSPRTLSEFVADWVKQSY